MNGESWALLIVGGLILVAVAWAIRAGHKQRRATEAAIEAVARQSAQAEWNDFNGAIEAGIIPNYNREVEGLILKPNERCCLIACGVEHIVPHKKTSYVGGSHGVSIRITKGVSYRVGTFRGRPVTSVTEKVADRGNLYITTQRVVFTGSVHVTTLPINKVADARVDQDRVGFMAENKPYPLVFHLRREEKYRGALIVAATNYMVQVSSETEKPKKRKLSETG
jgi:hypothetical protein